MKQQKEISSVHLHITSHCNMKCPYCCCEIPNKKNKKHYNIEYFSNLDKYFKNLTIIITGGEPTTHPRFDKITSYIKKILNPNRYILSTNGYGLDKIPITDFQIFNEIYITEYDNSYNEDKIEYLRNNGVLVDIWKNIKHIKNEGYSPCYRSSNGSVSYNNGLLYPCCVSSFDEDIGIKLNENWRQEILQVELPCDKCAFGKE